MLSSKSLDNLSVTKEIRTAFPRKGIQLTLGCDPLSGGGLLLPLRLRSIHSVEVNQYRTPLR